MRVVEHDEAGTVTEQHATPSRSKKCQRQGCRLAFAFQILGLQCRGWRAKAGKKEIGPNAKCQMPNVRANSGSSARTHLGPHPSKRTDCSFCNHLWHQWLLEEQHSQQWTFAVHVGD